MEPSDSSPTERKVRPARWPLRAGIVALSLLAGISCIELAARLLLKAPVVNTDMIADRLIGYRMPPSLELPNSDERGSFLFRLNSLGFRGPDLPARDAPRFDGERILLVGDSFLNSWTVREEDWVGTTVRAELAARGIASEVYALCAKDLGNAQELLLLQEYGPRARPTAVVLFVFPGNDLINNTLELAGRSSISPGDYFRPYLVPDGEGDFERRYALPVTAWLRRSHLFSVLEARWLSGRDKIELQAKISGGGFEDSNTRLRHKKLPEEYLELYRPIVPGGPWEAAWRTTEALILAHRAEAERLGARFLVVVIPHLIQVERSGPTYVHDANLRRHDMPPLGELLDWNLPEERLERFFHSNSIEHAQLLGRLRQETIASSRSLYVLDGHLGGRGHMLMGTVVAARLAGGPAEDCFVAGGSAVPVDVARLYVDRPLDVDFSARQNRELVQGGWKRWQRKAEQRIGGWLLPERGFVLAPTRTAVTLRGSVLHSCTFPARLRVSRAFASGKPLAEKICEQPGTFELSFELAPAHGEEDWTPVALEVRTDLAAGKGDEARLILTSMNAR